MSHIWISLSVSFSVKQDRKTETKMEIPIFKAYKVYVLCVF